MSVAANGLNYSLCIRFRPLEKARPAIGSVGVLEEVSEEKIEVVVEGRFLAAVLAAVREAHPYEEPAIQVSPMLDYKRIIGRERERERGAYES